MTIVEYNNNVDILVEFENGYKTKSSYREFKNGSVPNLYDKTVYGIGYIGEGDYKIKDENNKMTPQYQCWSNIFKRCYDKTQLIKYPTYQGCEVYEKWHCFQTFAKWFDENYYECNDEVMCLDKDILYKGNKIYSPYTCVFVPNRINVLFTKSDSARGDYPIGVSYYKITRKFQARCNIVNENKSCEHLGYFYTPEEAFYDGYKPFKE
jgi:hypothetical protein